MQVESRIGKGYERLNRAWVTNVTRDKLVQASLQLARGLMLYHRYEVKGMEHVPAEGPALVVVNHSLATYDSILLGAAIYFQTGRYPVGLADRRIFQTPGLSQLFTSLGAVEGTPAAGEWLLRQGHILMLAPGGMRESLRPSSKKYRIDWERRRGFARLALTAQVPVLLAACPSADDIYTVYNNPLTPFIYRHFKWPAPIARGLGLSIVPRPIKLTHVLGSPIFPPRLQGGKIDEGAVVAFHAQLVEEMDDLMREAKEIGRKK